MGETGRERERFIAKALSKQSKWTPSSFPAVLLPLFVATISRRSRKPLEHFQLKGKDALLEELRLFVSDTCKLAVEDRTASSGKQEGQNGL